MSHYRVMRRLVAVATLGALATVGCFVVDDEGTDDDGGEAGESSGGSAGSSTGGSNTGGKGGSATGGKGGSATGGSATGGSATGGSATGGSATGGSSGSGPGGEAVMKFCNELYRGGTEAAPLTVTFAGVEATAVSGTCSPIVPAVCVSVPAGTNPEVALTDPATGTVITAGTIPMTVVAGDELFVLASVDIETETMPTIFAATFAEIWGAGFTCADTDPFTTPPPAQLQSAAFGLNRDLRLQPSALAGWSRKVSLDKKLRH
jgi:hypothetical protein